MTKASVQAGDHLLQVECEEAIEVRLGERSAEPGVTLIDIELGFGSRRVPPVVRLSLDHPSLEILGRWYPASAWEREKGVEWGRPFTAKGTTWPPLVCWFDRQSRNQLTLSFSDTLNAVRLQTGVHEESVNLRSRIDLFVEPSEPREQYAATLRIDRRPVRYSQAIAQAASWLAADLGEPAPVPEVARLPMYSTWYSFHQQLEAGAVERQCRLARELGCEAVIVDDGWQTLDDQRGYAFCGDWQPDRLPEMAEHVARVQALGMKYLLWFSVPFVGSQSQAWPRFEDKFLDVHSGAGGQWGVLDPRFPEVREHLCSLYERAVREWGVDGLKLDFIDSFNLKDTGKSSFGAGRDQDSVPEAVDRLLEQIWQRLRPLRPELLVEFRQSYVGPRMRRFGNLFRAGDCPNDQAGNRVRTIDVRLLSGDTPAHADMMQWHPSEPAEHAATQLLHTLFSVPQVSVLLDQQTPEQLAMLRFWLDFSRRHIDVLQLGELWPQHPECAYPAVSAHTKDKCVLAVYSDVVARLGNEAAEQWFVVNASGESRVVIELAAASKRQVELFDHCGRSLSRRELALPAGVSALEVPASGLAVLRGA